jgi:hypothetical protein
MLDDRAPRAHEKYFPAEPSNKLLEDILPTMPHLAKTYPLNIINSLYATANAHIHRVDCRLTVGDISLLKRRTALAHLSDQDIVTAWIANLIERCLGQPLKYITNAASVRQSSNYHNLGTDQIIVSPHGIAICN